MIRQHYPPILDSKVELVTKTKNTKQKPKNPIQTFSDRIGYIGVLIVIPLK